MNSRLYLIKSNSRLVPVTPVRMCDIFERNKNIQPLGSVIMAARSRARLRHILQHKYLIYSIFGRENSDCNASDSNYIQDVRN